MQTVPWIRLYKSRGQGPEMAGYNPLFLEKLNQTAKKTVSKTVPFSFSWLAVNYVFYKFHSQRSDAASTLT